MDQVSNELNNVDDLMLTTIDNPYNPKEDYAKWQSWDRDNGYNTQEYIARLLEMEDDYDPEDELGLGLLMDKVIAEIIEQDTEEIYMLV